MFKLKTYLSNIGIYFVAVSIENIIICYTFNLIAYKLTGEGSMSISSALGSNTMDILLCLGLPWFIKCLLPASMNGGPVKMENDSLFFNCICLIASVVILNIAAAVGGFKVYKPFGFMCLVGQVVILAVLIINSLNVVKNTGTKQC